MTPFRKIGVGFILTLICLDLQGCGGSSSGGSQNPIPPPPSATVSSVNISCTLVAVPTGKTNQCNATVQGTGTFNSSVVWSVNTVNDGNAVVGVIDQHGLYTAPNNVPTPYTVTIAATSIADKTKSASAAIIVAGTIVSTSQTITAASGGTITLPDGSSVNIAPGVLKSDQSIELSEVSYLPIQPANSSITSVGPGLVLNFTNPVQFSAAASRIDSSQFRHTTLPDGATFPAFQFSIKTTNNNVAELKGSLPSVDFVDAVGSNSFVGAEGNYDSTAKVVTGSIGSDLLHSLENDVVSAIHIGAVALINAVPTFNPGPRTFVPNTTTPWQDYVDGECPQGRTLLLVHGMLSTVEGITKTDGTQPDGTYPPNIVQSIWKRNNYDNVIGFDYDWLDHIDTSGGHLRDFLNMLAQKCPAITSLDIVAHSEGVPVSMSAIVQNHDGGTPIRVDHLISLGGPIMGAPAADDLRLLQGVILALPNLNVTIKAVDLATIMASPFIDDLRTKNGTNTLKDIRSQLSSQAEQNAPQFIVVGGTLSQLLHSPYLFVCSQNCDGVIPLTSALAFNSGLKVYPLVPFPLGHNDIVPNFNVAQMAEQQVAETRTPTLACSNSSNCTDLRSASFPLTGTEFDPGPQNIRIFSQDSTGAVVSLSTPNLGDSAGSITWSMPPCSQQVGMHSIFGFDQTLVSNNVMQQVDDSICPNGPIGSISTIAGTGVAGYFGDGGLATGAHLFSPSGIAFDPSGNMYIADSGNNVVRRIAADTKKITTIAGTGIAGYFGDNGLAINARLNDPTHVVFDRSGNLYITDAQNERIRKVDTNTGIITTVAGNGTAGALGDNGLAINAELNFPDGVGLDSSDNVYIGDALNNRIRKLDVSTGIITTVAGTGVGGPSGDGGLATSANLSFPSRPAIDAAGNIYIADFMNNRVRRVDATTHVIVTVAGTGNANYSGDGGPARDADLNGPISVTLDNAGNLYIGETNNERIRVVNTGINTITIAGVSIDPGEIQSIAGNGVAGYQGDGGPATNAELNFPTGLLLDPGGNLFFADANNNVVRVIATQ